MRPDRLFKKIVPLIFIIISIKAYAQNVNLTEINAPLNSAFKKIEDQTGYRFIYTDSLLKKAHTINIVFNNVSLNDALAQLFLKQPLGYTIYNKWIVIKAKDTNPAIREAYTISGAVNDEKGQPVAGATVFLTNSKNAAITDGSGNFVLEGSGSGSYELVVNMLGFEPGRQSIKLQDKPVNINIRLKESNTLLEAVTIKSALNLKLTKLNKGYLQLFITNFIGSSINAVQCRLLNPEVLHFTVDRKKNNLQVSADDFLVIENNGLGYRIKYLLKKFIYYFRYGVCYYDGDPYYEELKGTEEQQQQWDIRRRAAYLGSYRQFFRALMNNRSRAEGFYVYQDNGKPVRGRRAIGTLVDIDTLLIPVNKNFKALIAKPLIKKKDTIRRTLYITYVQAKRNQLTRIKQFADTVIIDKNGGMDPGMGFSFRGQWGRQRIADLTPLDYFIDPLAEKK